MGAAAAGEISPRLQVGVFHSRVGLSCPCACPEYPSCRLHQLGPARPSGLQREAPALLGPGLLASRAGDSPFLLL